MKKIISLLLVVLMLSSFTLPSFAEGYVQLSLFSPTPVILISGDADPIFDNQGVKLFDMSDMSSPENASDNTSDDTLKESVINIVQPFLVDGLMTNNWEPYYQNLQKEIGELLGDALLDCNGEATNGSGIRQEHIDEVEYNRTHDTKSYEGYKYNCYPFWYDWRLDPIAIADDFHEYIVDVKKVTGAEKVGLVGRCLGTSVVLAYVEKYGLDDICGVSLDGGISNGAEAISEIISGKFKLDGNAINRFLYDCDVFGLDIDSFINTTITMLTRTGAFSTISTATRLTIYEHVVEGVTSALALSTAFTWPSYWAGVTENDFETAKNYIFGPQGSEKRVQYAGLIEKIDNYDTTIRQNIDDIIKEIGESEDTNLCIIAKYGMQMFPAMESREKLGDQFVSVTRASFGATTSDIYSTLSEEYIAEVTAAGNQRYISPDKQVDASTCLYPDYTWFVKGASHTNWTNVENKIMLAAATSKTQLTIDDIEYSQFMVYDNELKEMFPMTTENCDCYNWSTNIKSYYPGFFTRIVTFFTSFSRWLRELIVILRPSIKNNVAAA